MMYLSLSHTVDKLLACCWEELTGNLRTSLQLDINDTANASAEGWNQDNRIVQ